jgi:hypothetical protein
VGFAAVWSSAPEPRNLRRLKAAIRDRWGVVPLVDMRTETALRTGRLTVFNPAGTQNHLDARCCSSGCSC